MDWFIDINILRKLNLHKRRHNKKGEVIRKAIRTIAVS